MTSYAQPAPQQLPPQQNVRYQPETIMETIQQPIQRQTMRPQRSMTMTQTMETIMQPQPRTVMVPQKQMSYTTETTYEERDVPRTTMIEQKSVVKRQIPEYQTTYTTVMEPTTQM